MNASIKKIFICFLIVFSLAFYLFLHNSIPKIADTAGLMLQYNELQKKFENETLQAKDFTNLQKQLNQYHDQQETSFSYTPWIIMYTGSMIFFFLFYYYISKWILKPFQNLQGYADEIAQGHLDAPLQEQRHQVFGAFSWAFDNLRFELKKAKESEAQAIENSKTVIASLSHDIKTPISSIRACSEAIIKGMDTTPERRMRYLSTIVKKCDEVSALTDDLFLHSLQDMDALQYHNDWISISSFFTELHATLKQEYLERIEIEEETLINGYFYGDQKRIIQVIENICQNAMKYSTGKLVLTYADRRNQFHIILQDEGSGIRDEDLPFIFEKFFRGKGAEQIPGAGLGLFLVKQMMEHMDGAVTLQNNHPGLCVTLCFQKTTSLKTS